MASFEKYLRPHGYITQESSSALMNLQVIVPLDPAKKYNYDAKIVFPTSPEIRRIIYLELVEDPQGLTENRVVFSDDYSKNSSHELEVQIIVRTKEAGNSEWEDQHYVILNYDDMDDQPISSLSPHCYLTKIQSETHHHISVMIWDDTKQESVQLTLANTSEDLYEYDADITLSTPGSSGDYAHDQLEETIGTNDSEEDDKVVITSIHDGNPKGKGKLREANSDVKPTSWFFMEESDWKSSLPFKGCATH
ncbi:hypothetical protein KFE98_17975 [bacterium SCSIO 12741]|nr:hypothetical protein KFE98_17975 [bacterium SCSIO 12741]